MTHDVDLQGQIYSLERRMKIIEEDVKYWKEQRRIRLLKIMEENKQKEKIK